MYSFGVILWELATEKIPWDNLNAMQVILTVQIYLYIIVTRQFGSINILLHFCPANRNTSSWKQVELAILVSFFPILIRLKS